MPEDKRNWYITFISVTGSVFLTGGILYAMIAVISNSNPSAPGYFYMNPILAFIMGGFFIGSLIGGVMMFSHWIKDRHLASKIVCAIFFLFTAQAVMLVGILGTLPMIIYCIVKLASKNTGQGTPGLPQSYYPYPQQPGIYPQPYSQDPSQPQPPYPPQQQSVIYPQQPPLPPQPYPPYPYMPDGQPNSVLEDGQQPPQEGVQDAQSKE